MPIPVADALATLQRLEAPDLAHLVAQADARHVLLEVGEAPENFPPFAKNLDDGVTSLAYSFLAAGCSLAEQRDGVRAAAALERAARLLRSVHGPLAAGNREAAFHVLLGAMAAYAAGQYSWAFVMLKGVPPMTDAVRLVSAFLRRDRPELQANIARVLLDPTYAFDTADELTDAAVARAIARTLALSVEFTYGGNANDFESARRELGDAETVAFESRSPAWWWIARILKLVLADIEVSSPWVVLPSHFGAGAPAAALDRYVRLLALDRSRPVYELWRSQREALPHALGANPGAVISMKTSAGKTRVAELAMLQALTSAPGAKALFLAPFRSLAFEMEQVLGRTFRPLGFEVSHLYGGCRANRADSELAAEAHIIVATPEKARALFRAAPELFGDVRLVVVDEGHLLGPTAREIRNEMYYEHLRMRARQSGARLLLLSAALPNADQIASWIATDREHLGASQWRPSTQRYGLLRWDGRRVKLEWKGDVESFNPRFIVPQSVGKRANAKKFPADRNEAIAASAVRLWAGDRPVMIFTAQARSVATMARATLRALDVAGAPAVHEWPEREWRAFEAICEEELPDEGVELDAARAGVICHSNALPAQVRLAMEHLMRSRPPRVVIATKTLAQGVNLGVTTVIVASTLIDKNEHVDVADFLNIAGRAGRAFVDVEGKILFAIDEQDPAKVRSQERRAASYLGGASPDGVVSGVLRVVDYLKGLASNAHVDFERLVELAAEDHFAPLGEGEAPATWACDLVDDSLLSLHDDGVVNAAGDPPEIWVERLFRHSLAALQAGAARTRHPVTADDVIAFLRARASAVMKRAPTVQKRKAIVSSSLPFKVASKMHDDLATWGTLVDTFTTAGGTLEALGEIVAGAETWVRQHAESLAEELPDDAVLATVREGWMAGVPLRILCRGDKKKGKARYAACRDFYGFTLTWVLHAAAQQFRAANDEGRAEVLARVSLCLELGLPTETACRVFLAGVRSRSAAVEISNQGVFDGNSIRAIAHQLRDPEVVGKLRERVSRRTAEWLDIVGTTTQIDEETVPSFRTFSLPGVRTDVMLVARSAGGAVHLSSIDGRDGSAVVSAPDLPFDSIANDPRYCFRFKDGAWRLDIRDPSARTA